MHEEDIIVVLVYHTHVYYTGDKGDHRENLD